MALLLAGCSSEEGLNDTLSGGEKTPLLLETSLSTQRATTRAQDGDFDDEDQLLVYIQHVKSVKGGYEAVVADLAKLLSFTPAKAPTLYWDDFSNSSSADTDLRTTGHALRTLYGYCYNGGAPSKELTTEEEKAKGEIEWGVGDQLTAADVQNADLLWSNTQTPVAYSHTAAGTLEVPFTHAMSEVTVTLTTDETFGESPLADTQLTLNGMNTVSTVNAPAGTIESGTPDAIIMYGATGQTGATRTFTAIVAPGTSLQVGDTLLNIVDVEGNDYTLTITADMLKTDAWAKEGYTTDQTVIETKSGVNYHLNVSLSKTAIKVEASLTDWSTVFAAGTGDIDFENDVVTVEVDEPGLSFGEGSTFDLYWKESSAATDYKLATASTLTSGEWINATPVYWPNGKDLYFFRALSGSDSITVKQSDDVLWATTAKHNGIDAGAAIAPRTGHVPLAFEHAMTKIVFNLKSTGGDDNVDLDGAKIAISNLYTTGSINVEDGAITGKELSAAAISNLTDDEPIIVVPQTITDDAVLSIMLEDGTKYKLQLNLCEDGTKTAIKAWKRGKSYAYTITLKKEEVLFSALVKNWDDATGSGNATLDWD